MSDNFHMASAHKKMAHSSFFLPLCRWLKILPDDEKLPTQSVLNELALYAGIRTEQGKMLCFEPPAKDGLGYEERIYRLGIVETRNDNWHDFFNALVWLTFPRAKTVISARHAEAIGLHEGKKGKLRCKKRDALTHFDECGAIIAAKDPELLRLLHEFRWQELFCTFRPRIQREMCCIIFGHAIYERLLEPYPALTAKCICLIVDNTFFEQTLDRQIQQLDIQLAQKLTSGYYDEARHFSPLPVLGWPGACPDNENPDYYNDLSVFRPSRRQKTEQEERLL